MEFTASVPFARFPKLKKLIERRERWRRIDDTWSYFEPKWTPDSWTRRFRILIIRQKKKKPTKGELQLDLFEPVSHEYEPGLFTRHRVLARFRPHFSRRHALFECLFAFTKLVKRFFE